MKKPTTSRRVLNASQRLDRRTLLRGAGGVLLGLPLLEIMSDGRAQAAGQQAKRIITFFQPNGNVFDRWATGDENNYEFGPILQPLLEHKDDVILLRGIDNRAAMTSPAPGDDHETGTGCLFTATENAPGAHMGLACHSGRECTPGGFPGGVSIDQQVAARVSTGLRFKSLEFGSRVKFFEKAFGIISNTGRNQPLPPETNPRKAFDRVFSDAEALADGINQDITKTHAFRMSVLDAAAQSYASLGQRLGQEDKQRLDEHQTQIRELEGRLIAASQAGQDPLAGSICEKPQAPEDRDDFATDAQHETNIPLMIDMLTMAMSCDLTRAGSLMGSHGYSEVWFTWLGHDEGHHYFSHQNNENGKNKIVEVNTWYTQQFAYMLSRLKELHIFDETIAIYGMELADGLRHDHTNQDWIMTGGGFFETGRLLQYDHESNNRLFTSVAHAFGIEADAFGNTEHGTGTLPGLA